MKFIQTRVRSIFETANILIEIADDVGLDDRETCLIELAEISRMIHAFRQSHLFHTSYSPLQPL